MNDYVARNTARGTGKRGKWEVVNYRTGKRPWVANQGGMTRDEAMRVADRINRTMEDIELGKSRKERS